MKPTLSIDFETRSIVDLKQAGVYKYAEHWSTDVLCMAYALTGTEPKLWVPGDPVPRIFQAAIDRDLEFRAWNAGFEHIIWRDILAPRYGFPRLMMGHWFDTAAEAAALSLPRALGQAAAVLGVEMQKDTVGHAAMKKASTPRVIGAYWIRDSGGEHGPFATKGAADAFRKSRGLRPKDVEVIRDDHTIIWWDDPALLKTLYEYCRQDVRTEMAIADCMRPLSKTERRVYLTTQAMNDRGAYVDMALVDAAEEIATVATKDANEELVRVTGGAVSSVTKVQELRAWVNAHSDLALPDLTKDAIRDLLADAEQKFSPDVRRVLEIRRDAGKTSTSKLPAFRRCVTDDSRAHGLFLYHGASTGRWAGRLVQPQNLPRPELDPLPYIEAIMERDYEKLQDAPKSVLTVIAATLRSIFKAGPGNELLAGDFAQIEARVLAWLAGQWDLVEEFARGGKVYEKMAAAIYNIPVEAVQKNSNERQIGKNATLGAGFQMGADRFAEQVKEQTGIVLDRGVEPRIVCAECHRQKRIVVRMPYDPSPCPRCGRSSGVWRDVQVREDMAARAIRAYRTLYAEIPKYWTSLFDAACAAVRSKGKTFTAGVGAQVKYTYRGQFLWCQLPSGRFIAYASPRLVMRPLPPPHEDVTKLSLSYCGIDTMTHQWRRLHSYGGHLTENVVQAVARDLLAEAKLRLVDAGYQPPVLSSHDEVVCEEPVGSKDLDEFMTILQQVPSWAEGLPLAAEGWHGERYRK